MRARAYAARLTRVSDLISTTVQALHNVGLARIAEDVVFEASNVCSRKPRGFELTDAAYAINQVARANVAISRPVGERHKMKNKPRRVSSRKVDISRLIGWGLIEMQRDEKLDRGEG